MNLNEERTFNRILPWLRKRMPRWITDSSGHVTGLAAPDNSWQITSAGTAQPGPQGEQGPAGPAGSTIYFGNSTAEVGTPKAGDIFVNISTWDVYQFS